MAATPAPGANRPGPAIDSEQPEGQDARKNTMNQKTLMKKPRIGLALGSGSARGWAHVGVLHALSELGLEPDVIAGASVGSLVGAARASDQMDTLEAWIRSLTKRDVWSLLDATFRHGGMIRGNKLMHAIGQQIDDMPIETLDLPFGAVAADLNSGQEVWLREGSMLDAVRASSGLPGLFSPMWHQDRWLIDGGVVNPVPVSLCRALGADYVIAVNLNSHYGSPGLLPPPPPSRQEEDQAREPENQASWTSLERWSSLVDGLIDSVRLEGGSTPGMFDVITGSVNIMQDRITRSRMVGDPPNLMLSPNLSHLQMMDFHRASEAIEQGRKSVLRAREEIEEILSWRG